MRRKVTVICDMAFGSTGKGLIAGYLAKKNAPDTVITSWNPNAGHTFTDSNGRVFLHCALANGVVSPDLERIMIAPGSQVDLPRLAMELRQCSDLVQDKKLIIHENAAVIGQRHRDEEAGPMTSIGSTKKGCGACAAEKIRRHTPDRITVKANRELVEQYLAGNGCPTLLEVVDTDGWLKHLDRSNTIQVEGAQGFSLGVNSGFYPYCLSYDSMVLMADGTTKKMGELVHEKSTEEVASMGADGSIESKPIINHFKNDNPGGMFNVIITETSEFAPHDDAWYGGKLTDDHVVKTTNGEKRVDELKNGDEVYTTESAITGGALQIVLGSFLGDGCVCDMKKSPGRAALAITHGNKQNEYLRNKARVLMPFIGGKIRAITTGKGSFKPGEVHNRFESGYSHELRRLAIEMGCFGKKNPDVEKIFELMDWRGLAVWFQDDGQYKDSVNGPEVVFYTNGYTYAEVQRMVVCLQEKFGVKSAVNTHTGANGKKYPTIRVARGSHDTLFEGIRTFVSPDLSYKVPGETSWDWPTESPRCATQKVVSVEKVHGLDRRGSRSGKYSYCIEVEGNHNFFVKNGKGFINVNNCTSRECTPAQILSDCLISPSRLHRVVGSMRTYPIRVANRYNSAGEMVGWSGPCYPDQEEISFEQIGQADEFTTVTKLKRRIFSFSLIQLSHALQVCAPDEIFLNFANYMRNGEQLHSLIDTINDWAHAVVGSYPIVKYLGFGPKETDIEELF